MLLLAAAAAASSSSKTAAAASEQQPRSQQQAASRTAAAAGKQPGNKQPNTVTGTRRLGSHAARVIRVTGKADWRCEEDQGGAVGLTGALI